MRISKLLIPLMAVTLWLGACGSLELAQADAPTAPAFNECPEEKLHYWPEYPVLIHANTAEEQKAVEAWNVAIGWPVLQLSSKGVPLHPVPLEAPLAGRAWNRLQPTGYVQDAVIVYDPELSDELRYQVIVHEIGHVLGIMCHVHGTIMQSDAQPSGELFPAWFVEDVREFLDGAI